TVILVRNRIIWAPGVGTAALTGCQPRPQRVGHKAAAKGHGLAGGNGEAFLILIICVAQTVAEPDGPRRTGCSRVGKGGAAVDPWLKAHAIVAASTSDQERDDN